ncbi:hypothetical protein [Absidia glauca]|uniref:Uncharacterized protein n=1 Tax=Absidia glauca TaxID=4829 RepID=A0A168TBF6_ABSGL|nr:hypothetical protein [Absidia glauca]
MIFIKVRNLTRLATSEATITNQTEYENDKKHSIISSPFRKHCTAQLVRFLNIVYKTHNPNNNEVYDLKDVSMKQIISTAWDYCDFFDNKTYQAKKRCVDGEEKIRTRNLNVVKNEYLDDVANKVVKHLPRYQNHIKALKKDGYCVIGYIRKSPGSETVETRLDLLHTMSLRLKERSLVNVVFATPHENSHLCPTSASYLPNDTTNVSFGGCIHRLWGGLESVAVLGLGVVFSEAHNTLILQVWYLSIGTHCIFLYVEFEDGLSISVSKTGHSMIVT